MSIVNGSPTIDWSYSPLDTNGYVNKCCYCGYHFQHLNKRCVVCPSCVNEKLKISSVDKALIEALVNFRGDPGPAQFAEMATSFYRDEISLLLRIIREARPFVQTWDKSRQECMSCGTTTTEHFPECVTVEIDKVLDDYERK